jgi:hypothetical protein
LEVLEETLDLSCDVRKPYPHCSVWCWKTWEEKMVIQGWEPLATWVSGLSREEENQERTRRVQKGRQGRGSFLCTQVSDERPEGSQTSPSEARSMAQTPRPLQSPYHSCALIFASRATKSFMFQLPVARARSFFFFFHFLREPGRVSGNTVSARPPMIC